jgi:Fe-S cluster biogenesis protein NfuA
MPLPAKRSRDDAFRPADAVTSPPDQSQPATDLDLAQRAHDLYLEKRVSDVLDRIRQFVISDGIDIQLVAVRDRCVSLRLTGALCPTAPLNFQEGLEEVLRQEIAGIGEVRLLCASPPRPPGRGRA